MPVVSQNLFAISHSPYTSFFITDTHFKPNPFKFPNGFSLPPLKPFTDPSPFHLSTRYFRRIFPINAAFDRNDPVKDHRHNTNVVNSDNVLSIIEFLCLAPSVVLFAGYLVNYGFSSVGKPVFGWLGSKVMVWQWGLLASGMIVGAVIRRRQWRRVCDVDFSGSWGSGGVNLVERIEKLEEDLRSSATIIWVLSRQLEKLGIRFRVTRKALKEPIAKTAELAQKNSEATRALAAQEDLLEKELGEIQKVLLAMQEQQQKQLELILAIAKNGNLLDNKRENNQHQSPPPNSAVDGVPQLELDKN